MTSDRDPAATRIGPTRTFNVLVWGVFPLVGIAVGVLVGLSLDWLVDKEWIPFRGPIRAIDDLGGDWSTLIVAVIGLIVGLVISVIAHSELEFVTVDGNGVTITLDSKERRVERNSIALAFIEGKTLVLQDSTGRQAARAKVEDLPHEALQGAFVQHGYAWADADPYSQDFSHWVRNADGLPPGADAILVARQTALDGGKAQDVEEFRQELTKLGVVVRDTKKTQYWRTAR